MDLRLELSSFPLATFVVDEWGVVMGANDLAERLFGNALWDAEARTSSFIHLLTVARRQAVSKGRATVPFAELGASPRQLACAARFVTGETGRILVTVDDVTQAERWRTERDRLVQLASVAEILPSVLHEVKNPLAAAMTALEVLIDKESEPDVQTDMHAVLWELRRVKLVLDGVGALDQPLRSAMPAAVDHAVREACRVLEFTASRRGIRIHTDVPDLPLLPFDGAKMRAIVFNLVTNSIQASSEGRLIEVRLWLSEESGALCLDVVDEGVGMNAETLARCKELFFTTKRRGSGIGLALCTKAVEDASGQIEIESSEGKGTKVHILLPPAQSVGRANETNDRD